MGRNLTLFDFWFYITNFSRYPMEIYHGPWGTPLRQAFTFLIPVLIVVNVPARLLVRPLSPGDADGMALAAVCDFGHAGRAWPSRGGYFSALAVTSASS